MMKELYLSPAGRDSNSGTLKRPLRRPAAALGRIREKRAKNARMDEINVFLAAGSYPIDNPLTFAPQDGGITFHGEDGAVIDGGIKIGGWREAEVNGQRAWTSQLSEVRNGCWYFRQLFVNGCRRPRARYPKFGYAPGETGNVLRIADKRESRNRKGWIFDSDFTFKPEPGDVENWPSLYDAEIVVFHLWTEDRLPQPRFHPETGWIECARQPVFRLNESFGDTLARYYIDNLYEALSEPGEWYLNRYKGTLTYLPMPNETIENTDVFAPRVRAFVRAAGISYNCEKKQGDPFGVTHVRDLRFEDLTFRHADWYQPQAEYLFHDAVEPPERPLATPPQAAIHAPGAVSLVTSQDCAITRCRIEHVGSYGIEIGPGCRGIEVSGNHLEDLGAGGIKVVGGELDEAGWRRTGYTSLCDNVIEQGGRVFYSGVGILLANTFENVVAHNRISDLFYSGMSIGWSWGYRETVSRDNLILCNEIDSIGQGLLSDLGAIYTLGVQPGTVIAGNRICNIAAYDYGSWGLYLDEGSSHMVVEHNLVYNTEGPCLNIHFGRENIIRHNVLLSKGGGIAGVGRADDFRSATFHHNLFIVPGGPVFLGGYGATPQESFSSDTNWFLYFPGHSLFCKEAPERDADSISWVDWEVAGNERHSECLELPAPSLPADSESVIKFLASRPETADFGLEHDQLLWKQAGPRPFSQRKPQWQPLWRR